MAFGIVVAAGRGERLGATEYKFEVPLLGKPMVWYSLAAFQEAAGIEALVLVVPRERLGAWSAEALRGRGIVKALGSVAGGPTRQESVWRGLLQIGATEGDVVVHDAARPLVTPSLIERVRAGLGRAQGVVAAAPVTDTLKECSSGRVVRTVDRASLVAVQTPQAFRIDALRRAHEGARGAGFAGTDDASLLERMGEPVLVEASDRYNMKVTYPEDLAVAEFLLKGRGQR